MRKAFSRDRTVMGCIMGASAQRGDASRISERFDVTIGFSTHDPAEESHGISDSLNPTRRGAPQRGEPRRTRHLARFRGGPR